MLINDALILNIVHRQYIYFSEINSKYSLGAWMRIILKFFKLVHGGDNKCCPSKVGRLEMGKPEINLRFMIVHTMLAFS